MTTYADIIAEQSLQIRELEGTIEELFQELSREQEFKKIAYQRLDVLEKAMSDKRGER